MFSVIFVILAVCCARVQLVLVKVEQGFLRGKYIQGSTGNGRYISFKQIPYAEPPVGELRFKAPQPIKPWQGVRKATEHGAICPQINSDTGDVVGDEDCLFLNVYTPAINPKALLPVMIFIHGGRYLTGSGNDDRFGPDFLIVNNVTIVTINYRLGVLGFLALDLKEVPGNAGLKDQAEAMKWVKKNIARFGGDPNNVTIFGQSAGSSSVTFHTVSPLSKGLFNRAIAMSGAFLREISLPLDHKRRALLLSEELGLYTEDPKEAFKHLQNVSLKSLVSAEPYVLRSEKPRIEIKEFTLFLPIVEKDFGDQHFLTENPVDLLSKGKTNIDAIMLGHTTLEGICIASTQKKYILEYYPRYKEFLVPVRVSNQISPKKELDISDRIKKIYFGDKRISEDTMINVFNFYSDVTYVNYINFFLNLWTKSGKKAYVYEFTGFSERNIYGKYGLKYGLKNATHSDDLEYLFDDKASNLTLNKDSASYKMIVQTSSLYTNYAKYGNPTPDNSLGAVWKDYSNNRSYFDIGYQLTPKTNYSESHIDFWTTVFGDVWKTI